MFDSEPREILEDRRQERLPAAWLRRGETRLPTPEDLGLGLWQMGPDARFRGALIDAIDRARAVVCVCAFLWSDVPLTDALLRAAERGVRVYLLTASEAKLAKLPREDSEFDKRMVEEHKALLDKVAGRVLVRSAPNFHAKFLLVDPQTGGRGFISTANLNRALLESVELGVELLGSEITALFRAFCHAFWLWSRQELVSKGRLQAVKHPPSEPPPLLGGALLLTSPAALTLRERALDLIGSAQRTLSISTYGLDPTHAVGEAILAAVARGVRVRLLTRPRPAMTPAVTALAEGGVEVRAHDKLHAKLLSTPTTTLVMSANLEPHGLDDGVEVGVELRGARARAVGEIFEGWWKDAPWRYHGSEAVGEHLGELRLVGGDPPGKKGQVRDAQIIELPPVTAPSALSPEGAPTPTPKPWNAAELWAHRVIYRYEIRPPTLPAGARELKEEEVIEEPYDPPLYRLKKERFVVGDVQDKALKAKASALKAQLVTTLPEGAEEQLRQRTIQNSYTPQAFVKGKERFVRLTSPKEEAAALALAQRLGARIVR